MKEWKDVNLVGKEEKEGEDRTQKDTMRLMKGDEGARVKDKGYGRREKIGQDRRGQDRLGKERKRMEIK